MASPVATAEPPTTPEKTLPRLTFRSSFGVLWRWTSTACGLVGAAIYLLAWARGVPISAPPTIGIVIAISTMFAVAVVLFPVYVLEEGVRCYNFYGFYRTIPFDAMERIKASSVCGLKYLVVSRAESQDSIWIPLYLHDHAGFKAAIRDRAGRNHPLLEALERYA